MDTPHKYIAASVPRYIRTSRLWYLRREHIIGSRRVQHDGRHGEGNQGMVYDYIMLPALEFTRARNQLAAQNMGMMTLERTRLTPPYIPQDIQEITVLPTEESPETIAARHFRVVYDLKEWTPREKSDVDYTPYEDI